MPPRQIIRPKRDRGRARRHLFQGGPHLEARRRRAQAIANARAEQEVIRRVTVQADRVGIAQPAK
jgi:hypothetical protein